MILLCTGIHFVPAILMKRENDSDTMQYTCLEAGNGFAKAFPAL